MKNYNTFLKINIAIWLLTILSSFSFLNAQPQYIANSSGDWSSSATWQGSSTPGDTIGANENVQINSGVTVTLNQDLQINGSGAIVNVDGTLQSNGEISVNQGTIDGSANGNLDVNQLTLATTGAVDKNGETKANVIEVDAPITLSDTLVAQDTLLLKNDLTGSSNPNPGPGGAAVEIGANGFIVIDGGQLGGSNTVPGPGPVPGENLFAPLGNYNVIFKSGGVSATVLLGANDPNNVILMMDASSDQVDLNEDANINNNLILNKGMVNLDGNTLNVEDTLRLANGNVDFSSGGTLSLASNAEIMIEGNETLSSLTPQGAFNVTYMGGAKTAGAELSGSNDLNNVTVMMDQGSSSVSMDGDATITGELDLEQGMLDLNSYNLEVQGDLNGTTDGTLSGNANSELTINTSSALSSSIRFNDNQNMLSKLMLNVGSGNNVELGSDLQIASELMINEGMLMTGDHDLSFEATAMLNGNDTNNYIVTNGDGTVNIMINSNDSATYPVGTNASYSPATIMNNSNDTVNYTLNVMNGVMAQGTSGSDISDVQSVVDRTWLVNTKGQATVNMDLKLEWTSDIEVNNFDRNNCYISHYIGGNWDSIASASAYATAQGTFAIQRDSIQSLSPFAVQDDNVTGKEELVTKNPNVEVYPNPVNDELTIENTAKPEFDKVEVYSATGQLMKDHQIDASAIKSINVAGLEEGVYFLRLVGSEKTAATRFIKR